MRRLNEVAKPILIILPQSDYDPTEVAVPWFAWIQAGRRVLFATETGAPANCDPVTLSGDGLPFFARSMQARPANIGLYEQMCVSAEYRAPLSWNDIDAAEYAAVHFPGGHAPGMRRYLESTEVHRIAREAFASDQPVSAICHGVVPLARAGVLAGRRTTALTAMMEKTSIALTKRALGDHYRTYPQSVEEEVTAALSSPQDFERGPLIPHYATEEKPEAGFVVKDGNYVSARWPGDAWTLATALLEIV